MRNRYETIVFTREDFGDNLWNKVGEQLSLLTQANYICVVRDDDVDIIVIEFQEAKPEYGLAYPYWLYPEEEETVVYEGDKEQCREE